MNYRAKHESKRKRNTFNVDLTYKYRVFEISTSRRVESNE